MGYRGSIVGKKAGALIPGILLDTLLKTFPDQVGGASAGEGSIILLQNEALSVEQIEEIQSEIKELPCILYIGQTSVPMNDECKQPYVLLRDDDGSEQLVAFIDATIRGYTKAESAKPPEYFFVHDYLIEKCEEIYADCDGDISKFMKKIGGSTSFKKDVLNVFGDRGMLALMASDGDVVIIEKNSGAVEYPWGYASQSLDYTEVGDTGSKPTLASKPSLAKSTGGDKPLKDMTADERAKKLAELKAKKLATAHSAPAPVVEPPKPDETPPVEIPDDSGQHAAPSSDDAIPAADVPDEVVKNLGLTVKDGVISKFFTPAKNLNNNQLREAYIKNVGIQPPAYKKIKGYPVPNAMLRQKIANEIDRLKLAAAGQAGPVTKLTPEEKAKRLAALKSGTAKQPDTGSDTMSKHLAPVMDDKNIKNAHEWLKRTGVVKATDRSSNEVATPNAMKELTARLPSFTEVLGVDDIRKMFFVPYEELHALDKEALACLARQLLTELSKKVEPMEIKPAEKAPITGPRFSLKATG